MRATLDHLMKTTTAHGLPQIESHRTLGMKLVWLFLLLGATGICIVHMYTLVDRFVQQPTAVSISPDRVDFIPPDLFFCNLQFLSMSRLIKSDTGEPPESYKELRLYMRQLEAFFKAAHVPTRTAKKYFWSSVPWDLLHRAVGHRRQQTFFHVRDDATPPEPLNADKFPAVFNGDYFSCFRFQPEKPTFNLARKMVFDLYLDNFSGQTNKSNSVKMFNEPLSNFDFAKNGIRSDVSAESGMLLRFLQRNFSSSTSKVGSVFVSAGQLVHITLKMTKVVHQSTNTKPCRTEPTTKVVANLINSYAGESVDYNSNSFMDCFNEKVVNKVLAACGCFYHKLEAPWNITRDNNACGNVSRFFDSPNKTDAYLQVQRELTCAEYEANNLPNEATWVQECEGQENCAREEYDPFVSVMDWPTSEKVESTLFSFIEPRIQELQDLYGNETLPGLSNIKNVLEAYREDGYKSNSTLRNKRFLKENFVRIMVSPYSSKGLLMVEEFTYPFTALLAEIGGIIGLYLGMSVLTLFEVLNIYPRYQLVQKRKRRAKLLRESEMNKDEKQAPLMKKHSLEDSDSNSDSDAGDVKHSQPSLRNNGKEAESAC